LDLKNVDEVLQRHNSYSMKLREIIGTIQELDF